MCKTRKREIGNRPDIDKFNCSDNLNYQETINNEKHSLSNICCNYNNIIVPLWTLWTVLCYVCNKKVAKPKERNSLDLNLI